MQKSRKSHPPSSLNEEIDINYMKDAVKEAKEVTQEILKDKDCPEIFRFFDAIIQNVEESLKKVKKTADFDALSLKEQARIFADFQLFTLTALKIDDLINGEEEEEDEDYDDEDYDDEDDEDYDDEEDEDDEDYDDEEFDEEEEEDDR